jgi:hypothetical protein
MEASFADGQADMLVMALLDLTQQLLTRAIEHCYAFAALDAQNVLGVVCLAAG